MEDLGKTKSAMPLKRMTSFAIDFAVILLPVWFIHLSHSDLGGEPIPITLWVFGVVMLHTTLTILRSGTGTLGDHFLHLKTVELDGSPCSKSKLVRRNLLIIGLFAVMFIDPSNFSYTLGAGLIALIFNAGMFKLHSKYNERMTGIDLIFKTMVVPS